MDGTCAEKPLQECFEQAEPGAVYLVERHCPAKMKKSKNRKDGNRDSNLMTMFDKIVLRAGLHSWPMPGNNLRASLVTDLYNGKYPKLGIHTIAAWLGHSPQTAMKHYTRVRDEDFDKVRGKNMAQFRAQNASSDAITADDNHKCHKTRETHTENCAMPVIADAVTHCETTITPLNPSAQFRAQYTPEIGCNNLQQQSQVPKKTAPCNSMQEATSGKIPPEGLEPSTHGLRVRCSTN